MEMQVAKPEWVRVGRELQGMREAQALSMSGCARLAGVSKGNLSRVERGDLPLTAAMAWRVSRVLGPRVLDLLESGALLRHLDLGDALRRPDMDDDAADLQAFLLPGQVRVLVPSALARGMASS